jgi:hypothetical protein
MKRGKYGTVRPFKRHKGTIVCPGSMIPITDLIINQLKVKNVL